MIQQRAAVWMCCCSLALCHDVASHFVQADFSIHPVSRKLFDARNSTKDEHLTADEFANVLPENQRPAAKREFRLLDRDSDSRLSFDEFRNAAHIIPMTERGFVSDPVTKLVDAEMKRYDSKSRQWDQDDDGELSLDELAKSSFFLVFKHPFRTRQGADLFLKNSPNGPWMDRDQNQKLSRDEVRYALEVAYGLRRWQGESLRSRTGQIVNWQLFKHVDENRNDSAGRFEYINRAGVSDKDIAEKDFEAADTDKSLALSFSEWCGIASQQIDPLAIFLERDTDLDGRLSKAEIMLGTPEWRRVAQHIFPGFDLDRDGVLSVDEFRCTPLVDQIYEWHTPLYDGNGDEKLSRDEFIYELDRKIPVVGGLLQIYFDRYDLNHDELLSHDEFVFEPKKPGAAVPIKKVP